MEKITAILQTARTVEPRSPRPGENNDSFITLQTICNIGGFKATRNYVPYTIMKYKQITRLIHTNDSLAALSLPYIVAQTTLLPLNRVRLAKNIIQTSSRIITGICIKQTINCKKSIKEFCLYPFTT